MSSQREYELAMENQSERREFISGIDLGEVGQYVRKVTLGIGMFSKGNLMIARKKFYEKRSVIVVYPKAFSFWHHPRYADFYSTLIYHEGQHAKEQVTNNHRGLPINNVRSLIWNNGLVKALQELHTLENQVKHFTSENSDLFKKRILRDIEIIKQDFRDFGYGELLP